MTHGKYFKKNPKNGIDRVSKNNPLGAGRPSDLTDELLLKIKEGILNEICLKDIAKNNNFPEQTIYDWTCKNYKGLADKIEGWHRDRKLMLAEKNIEEFLKMSTDNNVLDKQGNIWPIKDTKIMKIKSDNSLFVAETLGKVRYSKRNELTAADGAPLIPSEEHRLKSSNAIKELLNENTGNIGG